MRKTLGRIFTSMFGIGFFPFAPGTIGSLAAVCIWYFLGRSVSLSPGIQILLIAGVFVLGMLSIGAMLQKDNPDPSEIVIDEWAGMWISCLLLPAGVWMLVAAFLLFRIFDIWKPFGIRRLEKLKGGWGIMMDDIAAGVFANVLLQIGGRFLLQNV